MASKGLCLVSVGFCKYEFEDCMPGEYRVCLQLLDKMLHHPESKKYIEFLETTGAAHIGSFMRWAYFRKKAVEGEFELFSDNDSRIKYISKVIRFLVLITIANLIVGINNIFLANSRSSPINFLGIANLVIGLFLYFGMYSATEKTQKNETRRSVV